MAKFSYMILLLCFQHHHGLSSATNKFMAPIDRTQMSPGVSYRNDFCTRLAAVDNGTIPLGLALADMDISVHLMLWGPYHVRTDGEGRLDDDNPGILPDIMNHIAGRGKFRWRESYGVGLTPGTDGTNATFSEILSWGLDNYDVSVGEWRNSLSRKASGYFFPLGIADASIVMVQRPESHSFQMFNWARSFTLWVWIAIITTYLVSAFVYRFIHLYGAGEHFERETKLRKRVVLFDSFMTFNGHNQYIPRSIAGQIFTFSINFFSLVIVSSYTANLVSIMINGKTPKYVADTWRQAELKQVPICVWKDTSLHSYLKKKYPDAVLVETITKRKGYEYLNEGKCKIVSDSMQSFRSIQRSSALNGDCSLAIVGSPDVEEKAGFATNGIGKGCPQLLFSVLDYHLTDMNVEGVIQDEWAKHLDLMSKDFCTSGGDVEDDTESLNMKNIGGLFIFHGLLMSVALIVCFWERLQKTKHAGKREGRNLTVYRSGETQESLEQCLLLPSKADVGGGQTFTRNDMRDMLKLFKDEICEELKGHRI